MNTKMTSAADPSCRKILFSVVFVLLVCFIVLFWVFEIPCLTNRNQPAASQPCLAIGNPSTPCLPSTQSMDQTSMQWNIQCHDQHPRQYVGQRSGYWVLYNYVMAQRQFRCWESVTYTTHADYTFLDNLEPLLSRWKGPISIALYAPGADFNATLKTIRFLRDCSSQPVADLVTFHIYFPSKHFPANVRTSSSLWDTKYNCALPPPWANSTTYRARKKLLYPINVGRNIAREMATTHYILAADIELYPSPGVIQEFLEMIMRTDPPFLHRNPKVFPLAIFEIRANMNLPNDKAELVAMLQNDTAIPFHEKVCQECHNIPRSKEWMATNSTEGLRVFHIAKRTGAHAMWEPIYIGTQAEPLYDERLSWEGMKDKMTQCYALCVLNYEFHILDKAFLVHKPGIKTSQYRDHPMRTIEYSKTECLYQDVIIPELKKLFGERRGCSVIPKPSCSSSSKYNREETEWENIN